MAVALILSILIIGFATSSYIVDAASKVATPTFSPGGGTYSSTQNVHIYCSTSGATIYYTTDGSPPTTSSTKYVNPITVSTSMTINAKAFKTGWTASNVASATYTLKVATPTFSPGGGTYSSTQNVHIYCSTSGATIYYTTNGSPPTTSSTKYVNPITVSTSMTINAKAFKTGWTASNVASATYNIAIPFTSFTLSAAGTAKNTKTNTNVAVTLSLSGSASGTLQTIINLNVKGGDFNVAGYSDITVSSGSGSIISNCKYNQFSLTITDKYGGQVACVQLSGTATQISSNTLSLKLSSDTVVLPFSGHPTLKNLQLTDTITLT